MLISIKVYLPIQNLENIEFNSILLLNPPLNSFIFFNLLYTSTSFLVLKLQLPSTFKMLRDCFKEPSCFFVNKKTQPPLTSTPLSNPCILKKIKNFNLLTPKGFSIIDVGITLNFLNFFKKTLM